jgi:hypothetical protein
MVTRANPHTAVALETGRPLLMTLTADAPKDDLTPT